MSKLIDINILDFEAFTFYCSSIMSLVQETINKALQVFTFYCSSIMRNDTNYDVQDVSTIYILL